MGDRARREPVGPDQQIVDVGGEIEADEEGDEDRQDGPDQPRAQLDQMIHQRRLGGVDVVVGHGCVPVASARLRGSSHLLAVWPERSCAGKAWRLEVSARNGLRPQWRLLVGRFSVSTRLALGLRRLGAAGRRRSFGERNNAWRRWSPGFEVISGRSTDALKRSREGVASRKLSIGFPHFVDLALPDRVLELALEVGSHAAELARVMAEGAHHPRQVFRTNHDDRHHADDQELRPTDVEHGRNSGPLEALDGMTAAAAGPRRGLARFRGPRDSWRLAVDFVRFCRLRHSCAR